MGILGALGAATLLVLPGSLVSFSFVASDAPIRLKWALAVALSPFIVAIEAALAAWSGLGFAQTTHLVVAINLIAGVALICVDGLRARSRAETCPANPIWLALALMAFPIVLMWLGVPHLRTFGWHHMMQMSAIEQIAKLPAIPEEMDLAGVRLNYGWLGHVSLAAVAWLTDRSATALYPAMNLLLLIALFVPLSETAGLLRRNDRSLLSMGVAAACLGTGLVSMIATWLPHGESFITEFRPIPLIAKLPFLDAMNAGLALVACQIYFATARLGGTRGLPWPLMGLLVLAIGITYPLLFPPAIIVAVAFLAAAWCAPRNAFEAYRHKELVFNGLGLISAIVGCLAYTRFMQDGRHPKVFAFEFSSVRHGLKAALLVYGPWLLVIAPKTRKAWRSRDARTLMLAIAGWLNLIAFLALLMPRTVQYKFLFATGLCWTPLMADWFADACGNLGRRKSAGALACALALSALSAGFLLRIHVPRPKLRQSIAVDESSFAPRASDGSSWFNVVRDRTPLDTVIVAKASFVPFSVLADRAAYIPSDARDAEPELERLGYSMRIRETLIDVKGYPEDTYVNRQRTLRDVLGVDGAGQSRDSEVLLQELAKLQRPIAIHFDRPTDFSRWLVRHDAGSAILGDPTANVFGEKGLVWFIPIHVASDLGRQGL